VSSTAKKPLNYDPKSPKQTRFPRIMWPVNPLDQIKSTSAQVEGLYNIVAPEPSLDANVAAAGIFIVQKKGVTDTQKIPYKPDGHYYSLDMDFALGHPDNKVKAKYGRTGAAVPPLTAEETADTAWGRWRGSSLVDPSTNTIYLVRVRVQQLRIEPLLAGFRLRWTKPPGWLWADGYATNTIVEVVSNPLVIIRRVISPTTLRAGTKGGFTCSVLTMYPGY
jgi:hypothetical protein